MTTAPPFFAFRQNMAPVPEHMFMNETGPCQVRDGSAPDQFRDGIPDCGVGHSDGERLERPAPVHGIPGLPEIPQKSGQVQAMRERRTAVMRHAEQPLRFRKELGGAAEISAPPVVERDSRLDIADQRMRAVPRRDEVPVILKHFVALKIILILIKVRNKLDEKRMTERIHESSSLPQRIDCR